MMHISLTFNPQLAMRAETAYMPAPRQHVAWTAAAAFHIVLGMCVLTGLMPHRAYADPYAASSTDGLGAYCDLGHGERVRLRPGQPCHTQQGQFGQSGPRSHPSGMGDVLPDVAPSWFGPPQPWTLSDTGAGPHSGLAAGYGGSGAGSASMHTPGQSQSPDYGPPVTSSTGSNGSNFPSNPNLRNLGSGLSAYSLW